MFVVLIKSNQFSTNVGAGAFTIAFTVNPTPFYLGVKTTEAEKRNFFAFPTFL